jgi:transketolase
MGKDITLIGAGMMVSRCLEAAEELSKRGVDAEVINCSTIKPLDGETIINSVRKTGAAVTAENHSIVGGLGSAVTELVCENYPVPVKRVGIKDRYGESAELKDLFTHYGLDTGNILNAVDSIRKEGKR